MIYVTHDQLEAVTMADRMAVMNGGVLQQYDAPERVFESPVNTFVAGFVGSPAMNLMRRESPSGDGGRRSRATAGAARCPAQGAPPRAPRPRAEVVIGARHSTTSACSTEAAPGAIPGRGLHRRADRRRDLRPRPARPRHRVVVSVAAAACGCAPTSPVWIAFDQDRLHLFDRRTEQRAARQR